MGFVSEELNETEKHNIQQNKVKNMAVVYGKEASMWKGKEKFLEILHRYMEVHGTVYYETQRPPEVPAFVKNHGLLPQQDLQQLLRKAKLFIGFGFPYEGPAPLEAIANGCIFLQPKFRPPHSSLNHEFFRGKPTSREVSSQHPYAEQYIGRPHVMTVDYNNSEEFETAVREIMRIKTDVSITPTRSPQTDVSITPTRSPQTDVSITPTRSPQTDVSITPTRSPQTDVSITPTRSPQNDVSITPTRSLQTDVSITPTRSPQNDVSITPTRSPQNDVSITPTRSPHTDMSITATRFLQTDVSITPTRSLQTDVSINPTRSPQIDVSITPTRSPQTDVDPYLPYEYTCEGMLERVHAYIQHQDFCGPEAPFPPANMSVVWAGGVFMRVDDSGLISWAVNSTAPPSWPPLSALRLTVSAEGQSCVDACRSSDLVCEPAFFRFINNKEALSKLQVQCEVVEFEMNHIFPAFSMTARECGLQKEPLLFSCAGFGAKYRRVCPCRDFRKGQVALCRDCL
ncbi:hypothetical protein QTP70_032294 [Hemibagrus guttatus]|uniref:alpha-1,6-mannosyl-glycoprotein 6-beta-N-acetylglucosaminyltransferase n=1 Tax=Hemibagrus guttatus TaxID=175788 RepID=A0AAE0RLI8_9TELE|nr:hypothetical protein QTP70_032294 [Hemibagrus guttatus]